MIEKLIPHKILDSINQYYRIVVGGIITVNNESGILFIKRSKHEFMPNVWEIPSGGMEHGETMLQALSREIKEETNLNILSVDDYKNATSYQVNEKNYLQINFQVTCSGILKLSDEHSNYALSDINMFKDNLDEFMLKLLNLNR
ncbi:NUDIX hydrolase [Pantoea sp. Nvir]|uniref:NUDIX hydrolase n=1 Tax=Pantoea sp. Nvir TaxID=2576760 RepID=UPI00135A784C|nr:NUDIX domain-containing protein [Pantoea sp. Nvir]MXP67109.1 NUDIX domain-containing protein [Pantoea sp. Nvir]CAJ0993615.1 RNA pyrophosphohydrolase [Pantoea sp. Nvir]